MSFKQFPQIYFNDTQTILDIALQKISLNSASNPLKYFPTNISQNPLTALLKYF